MTVLYKLAVTQLVKKFQPFMEPECPLPCSQQLATGHVHPVHTVPTYFAKIHPNIILSPTPRSSEWSL